MMIKILLLTASLLLNGTWAARAQKTTDSSGGSSNGNVQYGEASYYADMFEGRKTANGEIFRQEKMTGAHNGVPLGTWIRVTNLRNGRQVVVKINDRINKRTKRLVDLSQAAASSLGYIKSGTTRVKVEVLGRKPPPEAARKGG